MLLESNNNILFFYSVIFNLLFHKGYNTWHDKCFDAGKLRAF